MPVVPETPIVISPTILWCTACGTSITEDEHERGLYNYCGECDTYQCVDCDQCVDCVCTDCNGDDDGCRDDGYCDCWDCRDRDIDGVHSWDYRPDPFRPQGNYPDEPLLGLELEVGGSQRHIVNAVTHSTASLSQAMREHLYLKQDGSITGLEIVTHPMTLAWAADYPFRDLLRNLRQADLYVDCEYGLHVHVSRNAFRLQGRRSATHQMTWLLFMYRNVEGVTGLARRNSYSWAKFSDPEPGELRMKAQRPYSSDRYVAVNCNNAKTYELRFFQSTLDEIEFYAALEFADASVNYTRHIKTADILKGNALSWPRFHDWVAKDHYHTYPNLTSELQRVADEHVERGNRSVRRRTSYAVDMTSSALNMVARRAGRGGFITRDGGATVYEVSESCDELITQLGVSIPFDEYWQDGWSVYSFGRPF